MLAQEHQGTRPGTVLEKLLSCGDLGKGPGRAAAGGSLGAGAAAGGGGGSIVVLLLL